MPHANSSQISEDKYKIHPMNAGLKIRHCSPKAKNQEPREETGTKKHRKEWSLRGQDFELWLKSPSYEGNNSLSHWLRETRSV